MTFALRHVVLLLVLLGASCQPADPLDWKVSANTPEDYNAWNIRTVAKLPPELREEYLRAFNKLAVATPGGISPRSMTDEHFPLCKRLNGRTVRTIIIDGYAAERQRLLEKIGAETDTMLRNLQRRAKITDPNADARYDRVQDAQSASIDAMNRRLEEIDAQVKKFSAPASGR